MSAHLPEEFSWPGREASAAACLFGSFAAGSVSVAMLATSAVDSSLASSADRRLLSSSDCSAESYFGSGWRGLV